MSRTPPLSEQDILRTCGRAAFDTGRRLADKGRVIEVEQDEETGFITGKVVRDVRKWHSVFVNLEPGVGGVTVEGTCTCRGRPCP